MHRGRTLLVALAAVMLALTPLLYVVYDTGRLNRLLPGNFQKQYAFVLESYTAEYFLNKNDAGEAVLDATEKITIEFQPANTKNGIFLLLPNSVQSIDTQTKVVSATENGDPVEYEVFHSGKTVEVSIGDSGDVGDVDPSLGTKTYVFRYQAKNVVGQNPLTGEQFFRWNLVAENWPAGFQNYEAEVFFAGNKQPVTLTERGFRGSGVIDVDVNLPAEAFTLQKSFERQPLFYWLIILYRFLFLLPVLLLASFLIFAVVTRLFSWKNHKIKEFVVTKFEPPEGVDPFISAILLNRSRTAWIAQLLFFVLQQQILLFEEQDQNGRIKLILKRNPSAPGGLTELQQDALNTLFVADETLQLGHISKSVKVRLGLHTERVLVELEKRRLRSIAGTQYSVTAVVINLLAAASFFAAVILGNFLGYEYGTNISEQALFLIPVVMVALNAIIFVVIRKPALLLPEGAKIVHELRGLHRYMLLAEAERISFLEGVSGAPRVETDGEVGRANMLVLNEQLLPYAVIWGMENEWEGELARSVRRLHEFELETPEKGLVLFQLSINLLKK